ncbi:MAG: hypothetical protein H6722_20965 [Sandaracinus sp.]|nr:hypothetical protein [Myxococcales bacterium]MCB9614914.1 hypothetical protein [Sandaracinus sp.]MCB9618667.1 hypothetical protein [Sandaracinus sp.]
MDAQLIAFAWLLALVAAVAAGVLVYAFDGLSTHLSKRIVAQRPSTPSKPEPAPVVDVLRALRAWLACLR